MSDRIVIQNGTQIDLAGETSEADPRVALKDVKNRPAARFLRSLQVDSRKSAIHTIHLSSRPPGSLGRDEPLMVNCLYAYSPCLDIDTGLTSSVSLASCRT